jgi:nucleotide-binding universal stress UspA family protein
MTSLAMLCTDGSELATQALTAGLRVIAPTDRTVVVTVVEELDISLVTGVSGFGGGVMSQEQFENDVAVQRRTADQIARDAVSALELENAEIMVLEGDPGRALCDLASELGAAVLVVGSRGRGGLKRAVLGSVSDYLVRNAPCPIVVTGPS